MTARLRSSERAKFYRKSLILCNRCRGLRISFPQVESVGMAADSATANARATPENGDERRYVRGNRVPSPPMYSETFSQFKKQLGQLDKWLGMAADYAKSKNFDPDVFPTLRLAPDQFPLARQVQIACDTVKAVRGLPHRQAGAAAGRQRENHRGASGASAVDHHAAGRTYGERLRRRCHARREPASLERRMDDGRRLFPRAHDPERLFPPHDGIRDPASQRRARRQA